MDFTGNGGRIVNDPNEALGVAIEEVHHWRVSYFTQVFPIVLEIVFQLLFPGLYFHFVVFSNYFFQCCVLYIIYTIIICTNIVYRFENA